VRPLLIIFCSPLFQDDPGLKQAVEDLSVQTFIAQLVVEAFDIGLFPRCSSLDISASDRLVLEPVLNGLSNELRSIIGAQVFGRAITLDRGFQHRDRINGPDGITSVNALSIPWCIRRSSSECADCGPVQSGYRANPNSRPHGDARLEDVWSWLVPDGAFAVDACGPATRLVGEPVALASGLLAHLYAATAP
jgi:hypothetical protein